MEYAEGMPLSSVGWGRLSLNDVSQQTRIITQAFAIDSWIEDRKQEYFNI
jgi:hypothetical protein